jgi:hypothetical protein
LNGGTYTKKELIEEIESHDRIIMMGHGSPMGLFNTGSFSKLMGYVIDDTMAEVLRKKECISIWCNADRFFEFHDLKGFYSGMFISEVTEADYCGLIDTSQNQVDESNARFGEIFSMYANGDTGSIYNNVFKEYEKLAVNNPVANFNCQRLYVKYL